MADTPATRGAALALAEEKRFLEAGFEFLDEKRMLLASRLFEEMEGWRAAQRTYDAAFEGAVAAMKAAIGRHGFQNLQDYPAGDGTAEGLDFDTQNFLGLGLLKLPGVTWTPPGPAETLDASQAAEDCRTAFAALVPLAVAVAVRGQNIRRLIREYRATERRSRALENVIIPEAATELSRVEDALVETDQEEALRIRNSQIGTGGLT